MPAALHKGGAAVFRFGFSARYKINGLLEGYMDDGDVVTRGRGKML